MPCYGEVIFVGLHRHHHPLALYNPCLYLLLFNKTGEIHATCTILTSLKYYMNTQQYELIPTVDHLGLLSKIIPLNCFVIIYLLYKKK